MSDVKDGDGGMSENRPEISLSSSLEIKNTTIVYTVGIPKYLLVYSLCLIFFPEGGVFNLNTIKIPKMTPPSLDKNWEIFMIFFSGLFSIFPLKIA